MLSHECMLSFQPDSAKLHITSCSVMSSLQVTLAPLFVVESYLPFDIDLHLLPQPLSASGKAEVFGVPGRGECSVLLGVRVDVVYHVTACFEER